VGDSSAINDVPTSSVPVSEKVVGVVEVVRTEADVIDSSDG
jgi:hypothetical protein